MSFMVQNYLELKPEPEMKSNVEAERMMFWQRLFWDHRYHHRRRIYTEGKKAKVVTVVWGTECIQFLAALAVCIRINNHKFILFFKSSWFKLANAARN